MRLRSYLLLSTAVCWDGEDGGSPSPSPSPAAPAAPSEAHKGVPAAAPAAPAAPAEVTRPDYIPEKFWDGEKKTARVEDLAKSYADLERRHHMRTDDLRKTVEEDVRNGLFKDRPAKPEDYKLEPSKGFLPKGLEFKGNSDDPLFKALASVAHNRGLSQDEVSKLVDGYLESLTLQVPDPQVELKKLGPNAKQRLGDIKNWVEANIPKEMLPTLGKLSGTADGIFFMEWMRSVMGEPRLGDIGSGGLGGDATELTAEQLTQMQADPRYFDPMKRDKAFVEKINNGWKRLSSKPIKVA